MGLFDAYGRPVQVERLQEEQAAPTLGGVRNIYSTLHVDAGLTPERILGMLRTAEIGDPWMYLELAEAMEEKDLHYHSVLGTRKHAVAGLEISVQAASTAADDLKAADLVRAQLFEGELDIRAAATDQLDALGKGFSVLEIMWDGVDEWYPRELKWRDPRWFVFDWISGEQVLVRTLGGEGPEVGAPSNAMNFLTRNTGTGAQIGIQPASAPLAPFKFITHFAKAKAGLPIRGGLARLCAYPYLFKNYILKDWVTFAEAYGQPLRLGKYGPGASAQDKQQLLKAVMNIGTDCSAIIPESMMIDFIKADMHASTDLFERFVDKIDAQVSKGVLGQTMTADVPKSGGLGGAGAAKVHDMVRHDIADDDAKKLAASWNRDLVKPIVDINLGPRKRYPQIAIGFPDEEDLEKYGTALAPFIDRGLRVGEQTILSKFGLSSVADGDRTLHPVTRGREDIGPDGPVAPAAAGAQGPSAAPLSPQGKEAAFARRGDDRDSGDAIERFVERLRDNSDAAMAPLIRPLLAAASEATSYGDMKRRFVAAVENMDPSEIAQLMARAGFTVNLAGQLGLKVTKARQG